MSDTLNPNRSGSSWTGHYFTHSEAKTLDKDLAVKKPLFLKKNIKDRMKFSRKCIGQDWCKDETPLQLFGRSGKSIVRRRNGEWSLRLLVTPVSYKRF